MRRRRDIAKILTYTLLAIASLVWLFPLVWLVATVIEARKQRSAAERVLGEQRGWLAAKEYPVLDGDGMQLTGADADESELAVRFPCRRSPGRGCRPCGSQDCGAVKPQG